MANYYYLLEDGDDVLQFETAEEVASYISENGDFEEAYDEYLDCDGEVQVAGLTFYPSQILQECDPIAYNCGFSDFTNMIYEDIFYDVERMDDGDTEEWYGFEVECHAYEDEDDDE